ncbi:MAG: hypothetical protein HUJ90_05215, partial [Bacteroidales bacterium]|nr:hypothetical protein [Bacteroidales bacterium]
MKKIYILLLALFAVTFSANAQLYVDARHSFMTNYVWRGYRLSDNTKPASFITNEEVFVGYAFTDIFTLEGGLYYYHEWSHRKFNAPKFWISAYIGDFKLTINDYMPMFGAGPHNGNYTFGEYFKGMGWEGALSYTFSPRLNYGELPLSITWNTVIYDPDDISATTGKQMHSTYLELDIPY